MFATLAAAALPRVPSDMAPVFQALHQWKVLGVPVTELLG
jgi:hypothetical protein